MYGLRENSDYRLPVINRIAETVLLAILLIAGAYFTAVVTVSPAPPWLAWFGLLPLILAIRNLSPRWASASGALWGCCLYLFSTTVSGSAISMTFSNLLILVLIPTAYTGLMGWYRRSFGFSPLAVALGWVILELILKATGIGAGILSADHGYGPYFDVVANFLGYGFVAFLVAYTNAVLLSFPWRIRFDVGLLHMTRIVVGVERPTVLFEPHIHSTFHAHRRRPRAPPA